MLINEAAAQFCIRDNALLLRRVELFSLARQVARECAYTSTFKHNRSGTTFILILSLFQILHPVEVVTGIVRYVQAYLKYAHIHSKCSNGKLRYHYKIVSFSECTVYRKIEHFCFIQQNTVSNNTNQHDFYSIDLLKITLGQNINDTVLSDLK